MVANDPGGISDTIPRAVRTELPETMTPYIIDGCGRADAEAENSNNNAAVQRIMDDIFQYRLMFASWSMTRYAPIEHRW